MEHIAKTVKRDPLVVRLANIDPQFNDIPMMAQDIRKNSDLDNRKKLVDTFNSVS